MHGTIIEFVVVVVQCRLYNIAQSSQVGFNKTNEVLQNFKSAFVKPHLFYSLGMFIAW